MNFEEAKFKAIKFIGISKKTAFEVSEKLSKIGFEEDIIRKVIDSLVELGYINDVEYIDSYIRQNERMQKYSVYEISERLRMKGIKTDILENKINDLKSGDYEEKVIQKIISIKSKTLDEVKLKQYLYRRGFRNN